MQIDLGNVWCILVSGIFNIETILVWWPCVHSLLTAKKSQKELPLELWLCHLAAWHCSFVEWKTEKGRWETDTFRDQISVLFPYEKWAFFLFIRFCTCIENRITTLCLKGKHQHPAFHLHSSLLECWKPMFSLPTTEHFCFSMTVGAIGNERHTGLVGYVTGVYGCLSVSSQVVGLLPSSSVFFFSIPRHLGGWFPLPIIT